MKHVGYYEVMWVLCSIVKWIIVINHGKPTYLITVKVLITICVDIYEHNSIDTNCIARVTLRSEPW